MKNFRWTFAFTLAALSLWCAGCATPNTDTVYDKDSPAEPGRVIGRHQVVVFPQVRDESSGITAEHMWCEKQYPEYRWQSREFFEDGYGRQYHRVVLLGPRGRHIVVYFDVSNWVDPT